MDTLGIMVQGLVQIFCSNPNDGLEPQFGMLSLKRKNALHRITDKFPG